MFAELKGLMTQSLESLEDFHPSDHEFFEVKVEACIGTKDIEGGDIFVITVVTPKYLDQKYSHQDAPFLLHTLLVKEWNPGLIRERIRKMVTSVSGKDWPELAQKLSRYGYWEFEDSRSIEN